MNRRRLSPFCRTLLALAAAWPWLAFAEPVLDPGFGNGVVVDVALPGESYLNPAYVAVLAPPHSRDGGWQRIDRTGNTAPDQ